MKQKQPSQLWYFDYFSLMMITTFSELARPSLRAPVDAPRVLDDSIAPSLRGTTTKPTPGSLQETATLSEVLCHGGYEQSACGYLLTLEAPFK